jgi:hypothetical protein
VPFCDIFLENPKNPRFWRMIASEGAKHI